MDLGIWRDGAIKASVILPWLMGFWVVTLNTRERFVAIQVQPNWNRVKHDRPNDIASRWRLAPWSRATS
jgi:hypothetical protein